MKKLYGFILLALCFGLLLTWGALNVSAEQSQPQAPVASSTPPNQQGERLRYPECLTLDPLSPMSADECRIRSKSNSPQTQWSMQMEESGQGQAESGEDLLHPPKVDGMMWNEAGMEMEQGTIVQNPDSYTLSVYVENASGQPSANAYVYAYTSDQHYSYYGYTGIDGYAYLDIPAGGYHIKAYSYDDHFFLYNNDVTAPGTTTLTAVGTPMVTLTAKKTDGSPLYPASVSVGVANNLSWMRGYLGYADSNGELIFNVTPGTYDVGVDGYQNHYALHKIDQDFTQPTNIVVFNTSTDPHAEIIANYPHDPEADIVLDPYSANLNDFYYSGFAKNTHVVISANISYYVYQWTKRVDNSGNTWYLHLTSPHSYLYAPGESYTFNAGGPLIIRGRTDAAMAGYQISLTKTQSDSYGNYLSSIYKYIQGSGGSWVYPQIDLTDPNGKKTHLTSTSYNLPVTSPPGIYSMHLTWETGPFQGVITANSQFNVLPFGGLAVYVETAEGHPAVNAVVHSYPYSDYYYNYTGSDGYAALDLEPGTYQIAAYSYNDQFFLYKANVTSPGVVNLSAVGTPQILLTALDTYGIPLEQGEVYLGLTNNWFASGSLGYVDPDGDMSFHVTPGNYDIGVNDSFNYYALVKENLDFTIPTAVIFDMSTQPWAKLVAGHPNDSLSSLYLCPSANLDCFGNYYPNDGDYVIVSTGVGYYPYQYIERDDSLGNHWNYEFEMELNQATYFAPGDELTFTVGGDLTVSGRTEDAYVGDYVPVAEAVDSFGSYLTYIYTYTADYSDYGNVYPDIVLTDPNDSEITWDWLWYYFDVTAPTGLYDMHMEWDTGEPYQGLLTTDSQFKVLPQQTSALISPDGGTLYSPWDDTLYEFAPGTFSDEVLITHTVRYTEIPEYTPLMGIGHFFDVTAVYSDTGLPAEPTGTYTITIGYSDWQRWIVLEDTMGLYNWDGLEWALEPTGLLDPLNNHLVATPDHFSTWGVLGEPGRVFLAVIHKK